MKPGNVDGRPEIMPRPESVRRRVGDDLVEEWLLGGEIGGAGQRQMHPVG